MAPYHVSLNLASNVITKIIQYFLVRVIFVRALPQGLASLNFEL